MQCGAACQQLLNPTPIHNLACLPACHCQVATAAYCLAIAHLINHPRDVQGAITAVKTWLLQYQQQQQVQEQQQQGRTLRSAATTGPAAAVATVLEWLDEAQAEGSGPEVQTNIGFMRWGFVHAFRCAGSPIQSVQNVSVEGARCLCNRCTHTYWSGRETYSGGRSPFL